MPHVFSSSSNRENGSHVIGLALAVGVIGIIGTVGVRVWQMQPNSNAGLHGSTSQVSAAVPAKITNTATLNLAATALDQASAQVDTNLNDSSLNNDLGDLL